MVDPTGLEDKKASQHIKDFMTGFFKKTSDVIIDNRDKVNNLIDNFQSNLITADKFKQSKNTGKAYVSYITEVAQKTANISASGYTEGSILTRRILDGDPAPINSTVMDKSPILEKIIESNPVTSRANQVERIYESNVMGCITSVVETGAKVIDAVVHGDRDENQTTYDSSSNTVSIKK